MWTCSHSQTGDAQALVAPLGAQPYTLKAGDPVTVSVVIQNKGAAHSLVPEQRDFYEAWVQFTVHDDKGAVVMQSGFLNSDGNLDERAHSFTNRLINKGGTLNDLHQVWNNRVVAYNNTIQSGRSQIVRYQFRVPESMTSGALTVTAQVNYRRFNQHFINFGLKNGYEQPVVTMASRTRVLKIGRNEADAAADPADNPAWMRWNNYGIGLLDAQQYAESVHAFEQVAKLRPDYPDAFTNIALANFQWEKYGAARLALEKALKLIDAAKPGGSTTTSRARALYYMALVERNDGNLEKAIEDLKQVAEAFPESRDAHRELGFSYYQQHKYDPARLEYERVQSIDPDDLSAHYNLSILYRRLGMKDKSLVEAAKFADQKDDPTANTYAFEYLRQHDEIAAESVPWHVHGDVDLGNAKAGGRALRRDGLGWFGAGLALLLGGAMATETRGLRGMEPGPEITGGPTLFRERGCSHCHQIEGVGGNKGPDLSGVGLRLKKRCDRAPDRPGRRRDASVWRGPAKRGSGRSGRLSASLQGQAQASG